MTERNREDEDRLSTDDAVHPEIGTRIGAVPGEDDPVDISGNPGGSAGWGAWPKGMGTHDDADAANRAGDEAEDGSGAKVGARHGQIADSGAATGPVGT